MDLSRDLHLIVCLMAAAALWNHAFGIKTLRGHRLYRRKGPTWRTVRWVGLILFVSYLLRQPLNLNISVYLGLIGSFLMLIGTSLTRTGDTSSGGRV